VVEQVKIICTSDCAVTMIGLC